VDDGGAHESKREHLNGAAATPTVGQEEDEMIGPGPAPAKQRQKRPLQFEQAFLDALPSAAMYALSTLLAIWGQDLVAPVAESWLTEVFCFAGTRRAICIGMLSRMSPYLLLTSSSLGVQTVISLKPVSVSEYHVLFRVLKYFMS
jgi:hypothetical protein